MAVENYIVRAGVEDIFAIVIFLAIMVGRLLIKARQQVQENARRARTLDAAGEKPAASRPAAARTKPATSEDELRRFLEELAGGPATPTPAPPPKPVVARTPPPPPRRSVRPPLTTHTARQAVKPGTSGNRRAPLRVTHKIRERAVTDVESAWALQDRQTNSKSTAQLLGQLKQGGGLRQAILLREILGPPVAMRDADLPRR